MCTNVTFGKSIDTKIMGGQDAKQGQFPYQVSWCIEDSPYPCCKHYCGGSIYDENTIITAAHCCDMFNFYPLNNTKIVAGELDLVTSSGFEQVRRIKDFLMHPDFDYWNINNDICLLTLESPLELVMFNFC